jgi:hypothetical protein
MYEGVRIGYADYADGWVACFGRRAQTSEERVGVVEHELDGRAEEEGEEGGGFENVGGLVEGVPGGEEHWWVTGEAPVWRKWCVASW